MAFSPDGSILAAADADGTVVLFDLATGARVGRPLPPPYGPSYAQHEISDINDIAFSPDGRLLATAGNDGSMELWEVARRARISTPLDFGEDPSMYRSLRWPSASTVARPPQAGTTERSC